MAGEHVAIVSDAGTPLINDPGFRIVNAAIEAGVPVTSLPGPSAVTTALAAAGLPTASFLYLGYPPRTASKRRSFFKSHARQPATLVFYEAPHRLLATVSDLLDTLGDRPACLARNLTKPHERYQRGELSRLLAELTAEETIRGETTVLVGGATGDEPEDRSGVEETIAEMLAAGDDSRTILDHLIKEHGLKRREAYELILRAKPHPPAATRYKGGGVELPVIYSPPCRGGGWGVGSVSARVLASRRYRHVDPSLVERLATEETPKAKNLADAEKRTKRRLHQIFGAYTGQPDYTRLMLDLADAGQEATDEAVRDACQTAMAAHASTRERLPILDEFYERIFAITGVPTTVVDIACGLNPLAAPWMHLPDRACYVAYDIDSQMLGFVDGALELFGIPHRVEMRDIVSDPPDDACDLALLLKSVPCLDQQDTGASARVIRAIHASQIVVTFPTRSLGGHGKGMARNYRARFETLLAELGDEFDLTSEVELANELVFVVGRDVGRATRDAAGVAN